MSHFEQKTLFTYIQDLENLLNTYHIDHRFVGGTSFGGLINEKTSWDINIQKRFIILHHANELPRYRADGTMKDIDIISLSSFKIPQEVTDHITQPNHPPTVIEPIYIAPQKINMWTQFVTDIYINIQNQPYLVFEPIHQPISWESLEPWTVHVRGISYTTRNPIADYFAYQFRSPSGIKPKDKKKIQLLKRLIDDVLAEGKKHHIEYYSPMYFGTWKRFVHQLRTSHHPLTVLKRLFMSYYWSTVGEYLAHGRGIGKFFIQIQNRFTG